MLLTVQRRLFLFIPPHTKYGVYYFQVVRDCVMTWCRDSMIPTSFRSISWERKKNAYALILTRSRLWLLGVSIHQKVTELWPLMIYDFCQNFVSTQYLENELMEFDKILHLHWHWYWQDLSWDCYASIFANRRPLGHLSSGIPLSYRILLTKQYFTVLKQVRQSSFNKRKRLPTFLPSGSH